MNTEKLRSLIRESIQDYIKEIDIAANEAAMEARINKCEEAIQMRETKLSAISESDHKDLMDEGKIKMMEKEITELKKAKAKFEKQKEKMLSKGKKKEEVKDETITEEAPIDEMDVTTEMDLEEAKKKNKKDEKEMMNESFLKMQKLAGVITEAQYNEKKSLIENQLNEEKIPFFHLSQILKLTGPWSNFLDRGTPAKEQTADLKVGLIVLPKMAYRNESDIKSQLGKITKIEGDKVTIEKVNGEESVRKASDLVHLVDGGYQF
jgi:hypothetical protein